MHVHASSQRCVGEDFCVYAKGKRRNRLAKTKNLLLVICVLGVRYGHVTEQCEKLAEGETVELYNAKVVMVNDTMRIALDKWGNIKPTTVAIPGEIEKEPNFSDVVYKRVQQAKESSLTRPQLSRHR